MNSLNSLQKVHTRLSDALRHWFEALRAYAQPDDFRVHVNACITTLRQVTFILQSNKAEIPFYSSWYEGDDGWQAKFRYDAVMRWAVDARNTIEKRGDLETHSRLHVAVVASWLNMPTKEFDVCPFVATEELVGAIDISAIPLEIREYGLLRAERKWVATSLPERELLDALAHVAGQLVQMILSGYEAAGEPLERVAFNSPEGTPVSGAKLRSLGGKFPEMRVTHLDRTSWLKLSTGEIVDFERAEMSADSVDPHAVKQHYGDIAPLLNGPAAELSDRSASLLEQEGLKWFNLARHVFQKDGYHNPICIVMDAFGSVGVIQMPMADRAEKYAMFRNIGSEIQRSGANRVFAINEMWTAWQDPKLPVVYPEYRLDRCELLVLSAANSDGEFVQFSAVINRNGDQVSLGPTDVDRPDKPNFFRPIFETWGIQFPPPGEPDVEH